MNGMFDINLLSQIQALDRKFSVASEKPRLRRKGSDDHKQKSPSFYEGKPAKTPSSEDHHDFPDGAEDLHANIDITV